MNRYREQCFEGCWHSGERPCPHFVDCVNRGQQCAHNDDGVDARLQAYKNELLFVEHDRPVILVGMGTCGLANGAQKVYDAFEAECEARGIDVQLIPVGCVGYCAREVIVDIKLPGRVRISYAQVSPKDVPQLVERTIVGGTVVHDKVLGIHERDGAGDWAVFPTMREVPFFAKQHKNVLANCGIIDPESIDAYLAVGGYRGLSDVLNTKTGEDVVRDVLAAGLRGRGGGGFPAGKKWDMARKVASDKKYLICNADEGDPGAFMDRAVLEGDPQGRPCP